MLSIKNYIVNGCSFTDDRFYNTWATQLAKQYPEINYYNIASVAAGNEYIAHSTINFLETQKFDPTETLVLIMWSGTGRKDLTITGEWWYYLNDKYHFGRKLNDQYYLFSGGVTSWTKNKTTKKIFEWAYKLSDPTTLCQNSMINFLNLENYLTVHGYQYKFTSYKNYWNPLTESNVHGGDYSIGYFCKDYPLYQNYDFSNWFFINDSKDCLAEFVYQINEFDETGHPTTTGHAMFAEQVVTPLVKLLIE